MANGAFHYAEVNLLLHTALYIGKKFVSDIQFLVSILLIRYYDRRVVEGLQSVCCRRKYYD